MTFEPLTDVRSEALRLLSGGLYVLTTCTDETIHAAAISWVSQVSFQPPLVLAALRRNSHLAHAVRQAAASRSISSPPIRKNWPADSSRT